MRTLHRPPALDELFESLSLSVYRSTFDGRIVWCNQPFLELFGFPDIKTALAARIPELYIDDEDRVALLEVLAEEGRVSGWRTRLRRCDGTLFWVDLCATRSAAENGDPDVIDGFMEDVTPLVTAEARRREVEAKLLKSKEQFETMFRRSPIGISITTVDDGRILDVNERYLSILGYSREEVIGRTVEELGLWPDPSFRSRMLAKVEHDGAVSDEEVTYRTADGRVRHALVSLEPFEFNDQRCLLGLAHDITERKKYERQLAYQALYDPLTGLPNRVLFMDRLTLAIRAAHRRRGSLAVLFLDLDRFKVVNDSLGHAAGDRLLKEVAGRVQSCLREGDTAARSGGDEFTILLEEIETPEEATWVSSRIVDALSRPIDLDGHSLVVRASIGIAIGETGEESPQDLLRHADIAMYRAKQNPEVSHHLFDPLTDADALNGLELESDLRTTIKNGELELWYQPLVSLRSGAIVGVEGLLRWTHPERGVVSPGEFIPVAEESGFILELGEWVLEEGCRQLRDWQQALPDVPPFSLSLNLSARQFQHPGLVEAVRRTIDAFGLDPACLQLEITEGVVMRSAARVHELKEIGVRVLIDDFGTGYSSLGYLERLEVDGLKVDRTFVDGLGHTRADTAIVHTVITLAHALDLEVTAEGIQTLAQQNHLRRLGCHRGQGYLFSQPLPASEMQALLAQQPRW